MLPRLCLISAVASLMVSCDHEFFVFGVRVCVLVAVHVRLERVFGRLPLAQLEHSIIIARNHFATLCRAWSEMPLPDRILPMLECG